MGDLSINETDEVIIAGDDGVNRMKVNADGTTNINNAQWIGSTAPTVGQKAMASSLPVALASDQPAIPVTMASATNKTIQLLYESTSSQPVNANEWQDVIEYVVPTGYNLSISEFSGNSTTTSDIIRAIRSSSMAYYNTATNTFTDGAAITLPQFITRFYVHVLTAIGSGVNDTITITYTNNLGVTGRTATITITKSTIAGTRLEVAFQAGDYGAIDITNVTHTATGQAGNIEIEGNIDLVYVTMAAAGTQYDAIGALSSLVILAGQTLTLQFKTSATAAKTRRLSLIGSLVPV